METYHFSVTKLVARFLPLVTVHLVLLVKSHPATLLDIGYRSRQISFHHRQIADWLAFKQEQGSFHLIKYWSYLIPFLLGVSHD